MIRITLCASIILLLVHVASYTDLFSQITRPFTVATLNLVGIHAVDHVEEIEIEHLRLPWSRDCSGINGLILLWILTLWSNRNQRFRWPLISKLMLCFPAALVANIMRILWIAAFRHLFFPEQETPELHYLIGFLCVVPFAFFLNAEFRRSNLYKQLEVFHMTVVMAVLIPASFNQGGWLIVIATLFLLAQPHRMSFSTRTTAIVNIIWVCSGIFIGLAQMESFWLPWLFLNPRFGCPHYICSVSGFIVLTSTISVFVMHPEWQALAVLTLCYLFFSKVRRKTFVQGPESSRSSLKRLECVALVCCLLAPFFLQSLIGVQDKSFMPPQGFMTHRLSSNCYQIRTVGQPLDIRLFWNVPNGSGRQHALRTCLRFQGVQVTELPLSSEVVQAEDQWMREFFIHEGELKNSYSQYLISSMSPFSSSAVHIIMTAPSSTIDSRYFRETCEQLAHQVHTAYLNQQKRGT